MRYLDGITDSVDMNLSKLREIVKEGQGWLRWSQSWTHLVVEKQQHQNIYVPGTSLMASVSDATLPVQGGWTRSLVKELDLTCHK